MLSKNIISPAAPSLWFYSVGSRDMFQNILWYLSNPNSFALIIFILFMTQQKHLFAQTVLYLKIKVKPFF